MDEQKRRYTFGNNEFSLEDAYHDCKLVFDGISDDDSFQKADTGLILYYANEIIYALYEALQGKDTDVLSNDCISRQAAIDAVMKMPTVKNENGEKLVHQELTKIRIEILPPAKSEPRWTPVSKKLPPEDEDVQLQFPSNQSVGYYEDGDWMINTGDGIYSIVGDGEEKPIAWMPLHESYRPEG